jgi:diguanylate cyclase (GGDEF)-like protein
MKGWSIKWRVLLLALIPPIAISLLLAFYFTKVRFAEVQQSLHDRGRALVRQLAPACEYGLFTRNRDVLRALADTVKREADVSLVTISDGAGQFLAVSGDLEQREVLAEKPRSISLGLLEYPEILYFSEPIRQSSARIEDMTDQSFDSSASRDFQGNVLGWVNVTMSKGSTLQREQEILINGAMIALGSVLLTGFLALRLSTGITRPIRRLVSAVDQITQGDLTVQMPVKAGGELAALARGINTMTQSLKSAQENLQEKVDHATAQITYQASHDTLTGLINRREFEIRLERALLSSQQHGTVHALFFLDLDQFKIVNDTCGHHAGDELLRQVAHQLKQKIRERDTLARIGGDEFTVLLENCHLDDAVEVAQQLRETVQNFRFAWQEKYFAIGASIGIVMISNASENTRVLLSQADAACYTAKDLGRNRIYVFNEDDASRNARIGAMEWVTRITHAFQENRFLLYCQSILPLRGANEGDPYYYEILLRMRGSNGEIIPPMAFIPAAERFNQMQGIDRWVIRESFSALRRLMHSQGGGLMTIFSINLSGASLCDEKFSVFLQEQLTHFDIPPRNICFEITETTAISNLSQAVMLIQHFKRLGCKFLLDDFGAGLSSFSYLKNLPVDGIKIDGVFVKGMATNRMDFTMVESINNIGHAMGLSTTAEFVEDDAIMRKLLDLGVDYAQGNWVQRPRPLEEWFANDMDSKKNVDLKLRLIKRPSDH